MEYGILPPGHNFAGLLIPFRRNRFLEATGPRISDRCLFTSSSERAFGLYNSSVKQRKFLNSLVVVYGKF